MTKADADKLADRLKKDLHAAFVSTQVATLGGIHRPSVLVAVSLDEKKNWPNNIFENSRYCRFHIHYDGVIDQFARDYHIQDKFRKTRFKSIDDVAGKINAYLEKIR